MMSILVQEASILKMCLMMAVLPRVWCTSYHEPNRNGNGVFGDYQQFLFNPENYMAQLPSLSMPYLTNVQIPKPNVPAAPLNPTPVLTKVISVVTRYVNKNPVCIKVSGRKPACEYKNSKNNNHLEYLVTKEYYVKDRLENLQDGLVNSASTSAGLSSSGSGSSNTVLAKKHKKKKNKRQKNKKRKPMSKSNNNSTVIVRRRKSNDDGDDDDDDNEDARFDIEASESGRVLTRIMPTPVLNLSNTKLKELLIEDRLDHLEEILPHYKRKRIYQTSTITVTKVRYNTNMATATLLVKNCIPPDIQICPKRRRKTKDLPALE